MSDSDNEIDDDIELDELIMAVYNGEISVSELTDEEQEKVFEGYKTLVRVLSKNPEHAEVAGKMQKLLDMVDDAEEDPFEDAINEAESRGSIYWEFEDDTLH